MTKEEIIEMARKAGLIDPDFTPSKWYADQYADFAKLVAEKEREALEVELLKLKQGVVANSDYIQGRWDLIGEFQDIIKRDK